MNMNRNIKYKQVCHIGLFGDDDVHTTTNSQYNVFPSSIPAITVVSDDACVIPQAVPQAVP
jgi:hypothetical protein